jgi:hypothetical protein|tara:strand:- start:25 stop:717 length:693 start_codon:yes stop_codon:yes gene_type:complete
MIIYIVAGERNIQTVETLGGLYFNLGKTTRSVEERLKDNDYRRKKAGGEWVIIDQWEVEDSITDSVFHKLLEKNGVIRTKTDNTEEFFLSNDNGAATKAIKIIQEYIDTNSISCVHKPTQTIEEVLAEQVIEEIFSGEALEKVKTFSYSQSCELYKHFENSDVLSRDLRENEVANLFEYMASQSSEYFMSLWSLVGQRNEKNMITLQNQKLSDGTTCEGLLVEILTGKKS